MTDAVLDQVLAELEVVDPTCSRCGRPMPTRNQWDAADEAERSDLIEDGYVSPRGHGCRGETIDQAEKRREMSLAKTRAFWDLYGQMYQDYPDGSSLARAMGFHPSHVHTKIRNATRGEP